MAQREARRKDCIEAVSIVTPNHVHFGPAKAFLEAGIHVICDKPLTSKLEDALALADVQPKNGAKFLLTHNYTGYPMIRQAREMIANGDIGTLRVVQVEYAQDWLSEPLEKTGSKQAGWRTDPAQTGAGGSTGDIGTHAFNLVEFMTGRKVTRLAAQLRSVIPGRTIDDDGAAFFELDNGAAGQLTASQAPSRPRVPLNRGRTSTVDGLMPVSECSLS